MCALPLGSAGGGAQNLSPPITGRRRGDLVIQRILRPANMAGEPGRKKRKSGTRFQAGEMGLRSGRSVVQGPNRWGKKASNVSKMFSALAP